MVHDDAEIVLQRLDSVDHDLRFAPQRRTYRSEVSEDRRIGCSARGGCGHVDRFSA
jgi:hypothetical protein